MLTCFVPWGTVQDRTLLVLTKRPIYSESTLWDVQNPKFGVCRDTAIRTLQNLIKTSVWRSIYSTIWMVVSRLNFTWQKSQTIFKLVVNCWLFNFEKKIIFIQLTYKILKQLSPRGRFKTVDNYWARSSKISWFVSGEHISYLSKPKTEANTWSARQWQITIFCYNGVQ